MSKLFYSRLAVNNIRKNSKTYFPYLLTCIGTIVMFYNMCFVAQAKQIGSFGSSDSLRSMLSFGSAVIAIFSLIFLFYTNSFLMKRRKKEFGLFNILGMEKKHIARVLLLETLITAAVSLTIGLAAGILLSKLVLLLLFKIIAFDVQFGFEIPLGAVTATLTLFSGIFLLNLLNNLRQVHLSKPIELLLDSNAGEKEPKTKWFFAVLGVLCLGAGYILAITVQSPLTALGVFFIAVVLVMIGTYCLFTAGSIALLKLLRRNKNYYYKLKHFTSVSGMLYRMKQNAVGLANICILSTAVIVTLSTTVSLYSGIEDVLRTRYPRNVIIKATYIDDETVRQVDSLIDAHTAEAGVRQRNVFRYRYMSFQMLQDGAAFTCEHTETYSVEEIANVYFLTAEEYNRTENKAVSLAPGEALLYVLHGDIPGDTLQFGHISLKIRERLSSMNTEGKMSALMMKTYYVVVDSTETIQAIGNLQSTEDEEAPRLSYYCGFDTDAPSDVQIALVNKLESALDAAEIGGYVEGAESSRADFYIVYGGLLFLGLFLGLLFLMATVLIIYYKQIAEGYDDRQRFEIMQKVGMSHAEVRKSIHSQVLTVFFLPLVTAVVHIAFAFKVMTKLLMALNLTNVPLFALCTAVTILIFGLFYAVVYLLTARTYYKIVS